MRAVHSRRLLLPLVFISGMASLGVEFGAARLLAPFFGTSLYVWGVLIGLILVYLSAGYAIGGRLADRYPREDILYQITAWAGLWIGVIPLVSYPILLLSQQGFRALSVGLVAGTLRAVDGGQHPRHFPAGVLVHPHVRDAPDDRSVWAGARRHVRGGAMAEAPALRVVRGRGNPRVDLSACRCQAARGGNAPVRKGVRIQLHPGRPGRDDDRAHPQRGPGDPFRVRQSDQPHARLLGLPVARGCVPAGATDDRHAAVGGISRPGRGNRSAPVSP